MYGMSSQRAQLAQLVVKRLLAFQTTEASADYVEFIQDMLTELDTHHQTQMHLLGEIQELLSSTQPSESPAQAIDERVHSTLP